MRPPPPPRTPVTAAAGSRWGNLVVLAYPAGHTGAERSIAALVRCDCGNERLIAASVLARGGQVTCGVRLRCPIRAERLRQARRRRR